MQGTCGLQLCRYLHSFSYCCLPYLRNPAKFYENSNLLQFKVIQGHLGVNRKRMCNFLLDINSNYGRISYRFRDIVAFNSKMASFLPPNPCLTRPSASGRTSCNINVIYTPLKSTLMGYNSVGDYASLSSFV